MKQAKHAAFATLEQLTRAGGMRPGRMVRVQVRLISYGLEPDQALRLRLGSLVNPELSVEARIPAGRCVANQEDAALFDELRQDIGLHFGAVSRAGAVLAKPVEVVVTARVVERERAGGQQSQETDVALEPVVDFRVQ